MSQLTTTHGIRNVLVFIGILGIMAGLVLFLK